MLHVPCLTGLCLSGAGRHGNDIHRNGKGRVNYGTARKVKAQYWLKVWDLSTDAEKTGETPTSENYREKINPWNFVFPDSKVSSSPACCLQRRHVSRGKAQQVRCHIPFWAEPQMCFWNLLDAKQCESKKRWESGIPGLLTVCAANEEQMEPPAPPAFSGRLAHIAGLLGIWNCGKGSDDEVTSTHM